MSISNTVHKFFRKIRFKYFAKIKFHTVHLRGGLNQQEQKYFDQHQKLYRGESYKKVVNRLYEKKVLEIGFGNGSHLLYLVNKYTNSNVGIFGLELDKVSIVKMLERIDQHNVQNLQLIHADARLVVSNLYNKSYDNIFVLFPDPWPKKREQKRRLLNQMFVTELISKVKVGGQVVIATDIDSYKEQVENILQNLSHKKLLTFEKVSENFDTKNQFEQIFTTKFAKKAKREGRENVVFVVNI